MPDFFQSSNSNTGILRPNRVANQARVSPTDSDQWLRKIELTVFQSDNDQGEALNLTPEGQVQLQVIFQVRKATTQSPNLLNARIFNLAPSTIAKILQFRRVQLSAGYKTGRYALIFKGTVVQYRRGKENATDTYLEILAGDGDLSVGYDVVTGQWEAGTTIDQTIKDALGQAKGDPNQPATTGYTDTGDYGKQKLLRGMSVNSMFRDYMRKQVNGGNLDYFIDDGEHTIIPRGSYRKDDAADLTTTTGLVGLPEVTPQGIQLRCLLNPNLKLGGLVKVKTDILSGVPFEPGSATKLDQQGNPIPTGDTRFPIATWGQQLSAAFTSPTGTYKILLLEHHGETRGNTWYSELVCVALNEEGGIIPSVELPYGRTIVVA